MIDLKTIRSLVKLMVDNDLSEIDLEDQGEKVKLRRGSSSAAPAISYAPPPSGGAAGSAPAPPVPTSTAAEAAPPAPAGGADEGLVAVTSPMVGTFYSAPSPDAAPFVKVGDAIEPDTVVCLIEAMKVFNEIKAEASGRIEKVLVSSGEAVEFGQPLLMVRPA